MKPWPRAVALDPDEVTLILDRLRGLDSLTADAIREKLGGAFDA